jgi:hypothetical protein
MRCYPIFKKTIVENDEGCFEVWAEKMFCYNRYRFFARQVSFKVIGQNYNLNSHLEYFTYCDLNSMHSNSTGPIKTITIPLQRHYLNYEGLIKNAKWEFEMFKRKLMLNKMKVGV